MVKRMTMSISIDPATFNELEQIREEIPRSVVVVDAINTYIQEIKEELY